MQRAVLTYIGHATVLIEMTGKRILTDPLFRKRVGFLRRHNKGLLDKIDIDSIDAVVLSHMHFDHMDYPSLNSLSSSTPILAPQGAYRYLKKKVPHEICEMKEGDIFKVGDLSINATPSVHETGFYWPFWYPTSVLSFIIEGPQTIYFAGDTALFESMDELGRNYQIDAALLPVWGFGPYIRGDHLSPKDAASALSALSPRMAIPIHWGTLRPLGPLFRRMSFLSDPPWVFSNHAAKFAPDTEVRILNPGDSTLVC